MGIECICPTCKNAFIWKGGISHFERAKYHYCSRKCQNVKHGLSRRIDKANKTNHKYQIWSHARKRAKANNLEIDISPNDIPDIPSVCPILGIKLERNINKSKHGPSDNSPSLDRIDCQKGYIKGNIRIISNRANRIKSNATLEELEKIYKDLKKWFSK